MSLTRRLMMAANAAAAPVMGAPIFLVLGASVDIDIETDTADTITSASVTPPANARITIAVYGRGSSSRTHDSLTAGFATVAGFTKIGDVAVENPGGTFHRLSMWDATTTATPGSGTVAAVASGTNFQRAMGGTATANVGSRVIADDAVNTTGTTIAVSLTGATTDDVAVVATVGRGDAAAGFTFADGLTHAGNSPTAQSTNFTIGMGHKVSPSATQTTSGLNDAQGKLSVGALYRGAAASPFTTDFSSDFGA